MSVCDGSYEWQGYSTSRVVPRANDPASRPAAECSARRPSSPTTRNSLHLPESHPLTSNESIKVKAAEPAVIPRLISGNLGLSTMTMTGDTEETFTYNVSPSSASAEKAAQDIMKQIKENFTGSPKYRFLKICLKCDLDADEIWHSLEPFIEDFASSQCPPLLPPYILKEQSQKHLIVAFGRSARHIGTQDRYVDAMRYCTRAYAPGMFDIQTELTINPHNPKQMQRADFALTETENDEIGSTEDLPRLVVGEVMCSSETVEHAMNKMMAQRFISQDMNLYMLVLYIDHKDDSGKPDGKLYHVVQFYKPILTEGEAEGCRTTLGMEMGRTMIGKNYVKNGSGEATEFPGMQRGLEDGWDLCLLDQFVGLFDSKKGTPVEMKVIGPMTAEALARPLDLSKGSDDSKRAFTFNLAPYLIDNGELENNLDRELDCNLDLRWIFANINIDNPRWCSNSGKKSTDASRETHSASNLSRSSKRAREFVRVRSAMRTEQVAIQDKRDLKMVNFILETYDADVELSLQEGDFSDNSEASIDTDNNATIEPETTDVFRHTKRKIREEEDEDRATARSLKQEHRERLR